MNQLQTVQIYANFITAFPLTQSQSPNMCVCVYGGSVPLYSCLNALREQHCRTATMEAPVLLTSGPVWNEAVLHSYATVQWQKGWYRLATVSPDTDQTSSCPVLTRPTSLLGNEKNHFSTLLTWYWANQFLPCPIIIKVTCHARQQH